MRSKEREKEKMTENNDKNTFHMSDETNEIFSSET